MNSAGGQGRGSVRIALAGVLGLVVFAVVWELFVRVRHVNPSILSSPSQIWGAFIDDPGVYVSAAWTSLWHTIVGATIALVAAFFVGGLLAGARWLEEGTQPVLVLILVTPWVAYSTSLVLWLGRGAPPVLFLVAFVTFPGFVFAMVSGLRSADPNSIELFRSVDATPWQTLWRLRLPSALPTIFAAARLNAGLALAAAYFMEGANLTNGGSLGTIGKRAGALAGGGPTLWTTIVLTALLGAFLLGTLSILERFLLRWHASQR